MKNLYKIASLLTLFIGAMSIFAGSKVLLGIDTKNYTVLNWLVVYNVVFGFFSIVVSYFIFRKKNISKKAIIFIFTAHVLMLLYLYFIYKNVAIESVKAMLFRVSIWVLIILLTINFKPHK